MRDFGIGLPDEQDEEDPFYKTSQDAFKQDVVPKRTQGIARETTPYSYLFGGGSGVAAPGAAPAKPSAPEETPYSYLFRSTAAPAPKPKKDDGDTGRGFSAALDQTPALLKGAVGVAGALGENVLGEGGIMTAIKKYGLEGYEKGMAEVSARAKDTDDVTKAWEKAKGGDLGALVDWAQYGIGYLGGNVVETVSTALLGSMVGAAAGGPAGAAGGAVGGAVGKEAVKGVAKGFIENLVAKEATKLAAGKEVTEEIAKQATKNVAKDIGSTAALVGSGIVKSTGGIFGEAVEEAGTDVLSGADLARVVGAGFVAGITEGLVDRLGVKVGMGKLELPGGGRAGRAFVGAIGGVGLEGGTELVQTVIERFGADKALTGEDAMNEYINAFALGALGGGTIGGLSGAIQSGKQTTDKGKELLDQAQKEMQSDDGRAELFAAMSADEKIGPILEANGITSEKDPRFDEVVTRAVNTQKLLLDLNIPTNKQRKQTNKEREKEAREAFERTATTGVGVNMGAGEEGVIQRGSVTPDPETKTFEGEAQPATLPGTKDAAVSPEDMVARQEGFVAETAFRIGTEPVANRFMSMGQAETFLFGPFDPKTQTRSGGFAESVPDMEFRIRQGKASKDAGGQTFFFVESKPKAPPVMPNTGTTVPETGAPTGEAQAEAPTTSAPTRQETKPKRKKKEAAPAAPVAPTAPVEGAAAPAGVAPPPTPAAPEAQRFDDFLAPRDIPSSGIAKGEVVSFQTENQALDYAREQKVPETYAPREVETGWVLSQPAKESPAAKAKRVSKARAAKANTQPSPAPTAPTAAPPSEPQTPSDTPSSPASEAPAATTPADKPAPKKKAEKPAAKKAKETSKKKEAKPVEPTPPEDKKPAEGKKETAAAKKAKETSKKAEAEKKPKKEPKPKKAKAEPQGPAFTTADLEETKRLLAGMGLTEETKPAETKPDEPTETPAEQLNRLARERKAALTKEGKDKVDAVEQSLASMLDWANRVEEARIEGGGVVDPTDTSRPNLSKAISKFVDAVANMFGDGNVASVFVALVKDQRDLSSVYAEFEATGKVEGADTSFPARMDYSETTLDIPAEQLKRIEEQIAELSEVNRIAKNKKAVQIYRDAIQRSVAKKLTKLVGKDNVQAVFDQIRSRVTFLREVSNWVQRNLERRNKRDRGNVVPGMEEAMPLAALDKTDQKLLRDPEIAEEWDARMKDWFGAPTPEDGPMWAELRRTDPVLALRFAIAFKARKPKTGFEQVLKTIETNRRREGDVRQLLVARDEATRREAEVNKAERIEKKLKSRAVLTKADKDLLAERFGEKYLTSFVDALLKYQTAPSKAPESLRPIIRKALDFLAEGNVPAEKADVQDWNKGIPPGALRLFNKRLSDLVQNGAPLTEVLQLIARSSPNNRSRQMAGLILRNGNPDAEVIFLNEEQAMIAREAYERKNGNPNDLAAFYDDTQQLIGLLTPDNIEYFVLHEGTHAGTLRAIEMKTPAGLELVELYELYKNQLGDAEDVYGAKNAKEFIAEALSSEAFKRKLESIKSPKYKNLWEHFKAILRRIFRIGETAEQKSLFDRVLELAPRVMQENAALMNPMPFEQLTAAALRVEGPFKESSYRKPVVDWAKERFGDRKAPDGTIVWQNFVAWFGDSKTVDGDDQPIVFYHGTSQNIFMFKPKQANAIFVTTDVRFAEDFTDMSEDFMAGKWREYITEADAKKAFAKVRAENNARTMKEEDFRRAYSAELKLELRNYLPSRANILPLYVRAENPFDYDNRAHAEAVFKYVRNNGLDERELPAGWLNSLSQGVWGVVEHPSVQQAIRALGYDSFYVKESGRKNLGVYDPNALKAVHNRGQFSSGPMIDAATKQSGGIGPLFSTFSRFLGAENTPGSPERGNKLRNPVTLKNGTRLTGFTDYAQTTFSGFDKGGNRVSVRVSSVKPGDIASSRDGNKTADALKDALTQRFTVGDIAAATKQSAADAAKPAWTVEESGKKDNWIYLLVNKQIDLKRVMDGLEKAGKKISDQWNAYLQEELFHGRSAKRVKNFLELEMKPILRQMAANNVQIDELDDYLHARHAEEANRQVARINSELPDGGSGWKTADAKRHLASLSPSRRAVLESIAKKVDAMTKGTREMMVEYGLESRDTINKWEATYKNYVPLFRAEVEDGSLGIGQGYSVRGSTTRRRVGSERDVVDVFANIAAQRERVIVRGEKNRVSNALYGLVAQNPNKGFWVAINPNADDKQKLADELRRMGLDPDSVSEITKQPLRRVVDKATGMVVNRVNPMLPSQPNVLMTRVNGEDRMIIFNANDQRAMRMVASMKSLDANQLGQSLAAMGDAGGYINNALAAIGAGTRYFAAIQTQYNPAFGIYNFLRDLGGATLNLSSTPLRGQEKKVIANAIEAGLNIWKDLRLLRDGQRAQSEWGKLFEEFDLEGGKTGFRDLFVKMENKNKNLQKELDVMRGDTPAAAARAKAQYLADVLSDFNEAIENAIRLSAYKAAKEQGLSNQQAASIAKNLTVNFNRKGAASNSFSLLYAFFNASVQGSARLAETLSGPAGKKIIKGLALLGVSQAALLAMSGFDEDEPPDFVKDKNIIIPTGGGKYIAIPLPLGFNVIPALTRRMVELITSDDPNVGKAVVGMFETVLDGFNPLGSATIAQTLSPTVTDPIIALAENKDFTGKPIARDDMNPLDPTPGYTRGKQNATAVATALAEAINYVTGGTAAKQGAISPTPDQLEYLVGQATGGVGRELLKIAKVAESMVSGEELATYNIPVVGRLGGNLKERAIETSRYYDNVKKLNEHQREFEMLVKKGEGGDYMQSNPEAVLYKASDSLYRQISTLKRQRRELAARDDIDQAVLKQLDDQVFVMMSTFNERVRQAKAQAQ